MSKIAATRPTGQHQDDDLQCACQQGDREVAGDDQAAGHRRGKQFAARSAGAVDDDPDPGERAGQRDQQADCADDDERSIVDAALPGRRDHLRERRGNHQREQDGSRQRREDLAWRVCAEREAPWGKRYPAA
jgi:hypothetical protein